MLITPNLPNHNTHANQKFNKSVMPFIQLAWKNKKILAQNHKVFDRLSLHLENVNLDFYQSNTNLATTQRSVQFGLGNIKTKYSIT